MKYITIPRSLIYDKDLGHKRVTMFCYLFSRKSIDERIAFSISDLCKWLEMTPNPRKDKTNSQVLNMLNDFSSKGYLKSGYDFMNISLSDTDTYHFAFADNGLSPKNNFAIVYLDELDKILNYSNLFLEDERKRVNIGLLLLVLSYIRVNMNEDKSKPLCCYRLYDTIGSDTGIDSKYIGKIVSLLKNMKIISQYEVKRNRYKNDECYIFKTPVKIFADYRKLIVGTNEIDKTYSPKTQFESQINIWKDDIKWMK